MVETNVTELLSLRNLFSRLVNGEPMEYKTAKKFGTLMGLMLQYDSMLNEHKDAPANDLMAQIVQVDITFTEDELVNIKMTPLETYILEKFIKS